jgi:hypothetical protein
MTAANCSASVRCYRMAQKQRTALRRSECMTKSLKEGTATVSSTAGTPSGLLRLWVDANHDGTCDPGETWPLSRWRIVGLSLEAASMTVDAAGNSHSLRSTYWQQLGAVRRAFSMDSIGFRGR